ENGTTIITGYGSPTYYEGKISVINNLFSNSSHRTPSTGGSGRWDIINNVYYNQPNRLSNLNFGSPDVNSIGNYHKPGALVDAPDRRNNVVQTATPKIYSAWNYHPFYQPIPQDNQTNLWTDFWEYGQALPPSYFSNSEFPVLGGYTYTTAAQ